MKSPRTVLFPLAVFTIGVFLGATVSRSQPGVVYVDSATAKYTEVAPGAMTATLSGDPSAGAYAVFTKFPPGSIHPLHSHTNDVRIVVIKGAYIYKPEKGATKRVTAGQYIFIPGGDRHTS